EQKGKHSSIPQRASLQPAARTPAKNKAIPDALEEYDDVWPVRISSSARRYQGLATTDDQVIQQGNKRIVIHHAMPPPRQPLSEPVTTQPKHWLFWLGCIFCIMLLGWTVLSILSGFIQHKRDDLLYGNPRTFQIDAIVGHYGRVSHFVAVNLDGYIEIFETQRGHPEVAKIYTPTVLLINPTDPVILSFQDVNGDSKPDMIITAPSFQAVLFNTGTSFQSQPPTPSH
ncbi:MAG: hypothetical protein ACJ8DI_02615, partial [Ktedonobacteraceae bacterium]